MFVGILPGTELPDPDAAAPRVREPRRRRSRTPPTATRRVTVVYTSCPAGVTVERVVQVAANRLLWVQVRSAERATANAVLDTVATSGL